MQLNTLLELSSILAIHQKTGNMSNGLMNAQLNVVKAHDLHIPTYTFNSPCHQTIEYDVHVNTPWKRCEEYVLGWIWV